MSEVARQFIERTEPRKPIRCTAIRYTGENADAIKEEAQRRWREFSTYGEAPYMEEVEAVALIPYRNSSRFLVFEAGNGNLAVAGRGDWVMWQNNARPWARAQDDFEEFYRPVDEGLTKDQEVRA